ncbi:MAG TPA: regulatory iron-sulfur-containing complex subunit RicT [bacterium]|jgi:cell fate regulator YaaT (PSP1 superfamily)|nr:regulatory iron-sulfur-containing complex subunit RicT [bacterium]HNT64200.1 regulatory iron-sulfur-containing complex subunit RicT [bacterium]HOX85190.1 regulatory iron-sulfur-containing complex subunit RicT [bacterium]HPG44349.1 regulatory iron-sulfur-containing complex subunit RicT [bacterium]HPM96907.1 regulatory iron-sulfur-containing complex subunit RicT [bacterium]
MMIEILFKGERKEIYQNPMQFPFKVGDFAVVEAEKGEDLGVVNQIGPVLERKVKKGECRTIIRKMTPNDEKRYQENRKKEVKAYHLCRKKISEHQLDMKLVDVEYQFDGNKITFYFTADQRVDFRELVKDLAGVYKVRIELRQIGVRDEAKRVGGYGICGRKLCCTTFLTEFEPITTQCAKEQNLPLNPQKLSGVCGRLLCCLMYERNFYRRQMQRLPAIGAVYRGKTGDLQVIQVNVFNETATLLTPEQKLEILGLEELKDLNLVKMKKSSSKEEDEKETLALEG